MSINFYAEAREKLIKSQLISMTELSLTPIIKLWKNILILPLIGSLDSERSRKIMENLLQKIAETSSNIAIIDITGVTTVDTLIAQSIIKTVSATRLMGSDCIISGISPQIAQIIVGLGLDLSNITTTSNLADAFALALKKEGIKLENIEE